MREKDRYSTRRRFLSGASSVGTLALAAPVWPLSSSASALQIAASSTHARLSAVSLDDDLKSTIKEIANIFEIGRPQPNYAYVENLHDGRGYTVTNYGFCTANGEVSQVIREYVKMVPRSALSRFLRILPPTPGGLEAPSDFPEEWRHEIDASDSLPSACEREADVLFFDPAMRAADSASIESSIGKLTFYDTWLQHGGDNDADSFQAIFAETVRRVGTLRYCTESSFIRAFLKVRKAVLFHASEPDTRSVWRRSAPRIDALAELLDSNPKLIRPIRVVNREINVVLD